MTTLQELKQYGAIPEYKNIYNVEKLIDCQNIILRKFGRYKEKAQQGNTEVITFLQALLREERNIVARIETLKKGQLV